MTTIRIATLTLLAAATVAIAPGCGTSRAPNATTSHPPATAAASSALPSPTGTAQSACADLGGALDPGHNCHLHTATARYTLDFSFPLDYPDPRALTDFLTQERDQFVGWVAENPPRSFPYELKIVGRAYRSVAGSATESLVFTIGSDTGIHPVATYRAFNFDLKTHAPITFETLFKPGTQPLEVLNPIVQRELGKHDAPGPLSLNDLGVNAYRNFAITDDTVIFFFDQDTLLPHEDGPLKVTVPRTELASMLANA